MLQGFFFESFKIIDSWKCLQHFLFRDCIFSLLLSLNKVYIRLFCLMWSSLSLVIGIINSKVLRNHDINNGTWRNAYLQISGLLLLLTFWILITFPINLVHILRKNWYTSSFLNSDILLNLTSATEVWTVLNIFHCRIPLTI